MKVRIALLTLMVVVLLAVPFVIQVRTAQAASSLVSCGLGKDNANPCTICDLVKLFKDVIDFVTFRLTLILGTVLVIAAGFMMVLGGANPEMVKSGQSMLTNTLIGVVIIYGSWFVANFVLKSLAGDNDQAKKWYQLECTDPREPQLPEPPTFGITTPNDATARRTLREAGVDVKDTADLSGTQQATINAVISVRNRCGCIMTVTSGVDSEHSEVGGHYDGYSVDVRIDNGLANYITSNFNQISSSPTAGYSRYIDPNTGAMWMNEGDHWHVDSRGQGV